MLDETGVELRHVSTIEEEMTFSVTIDGQTLGDVTFATYYERGIKALVPYVALWAGPTLYVVDRQQGTLRSVERNDETHRIHPFNDAWIVEGELRIELFNPTTLQVVASYTHDEVITDSWLEGELICIRDFQQRTICLQPSENLKPLACPS